MRSSDSKWSAGDLISHRLNPELGIGRISALEGRVLRIDFPRVSTTLRVAANVDVLQRVHLTHGRLVRYHDTRGQARITGTLEDGRLTLDDGSTRAPHELWPVEIDDDLAERLVLGDIDDVRDVVARLRLLDLRAMREAGGLGSFLGGRVRLFPHQLHVAVTATATLPVRWLLADEVGLGKTIEAALILNHLVHTTKVERCVVVAPESLTVQWLGELWRKYHHVFTLLDAARLADVARDFGADMNPFDAHRRVVVALETLIQRPELTTHAVRAGIDVLIVDEAQRLQRPPGHPGNPAWRAVAPITALGRHVLLLTATPLHDDAHGFARLLQMLRPDHLGDDVSTDALLRAGLPACTSATRRIDIGGLPPRRPMAVRIAATSSRTAVEEEIRRAPAPNPLAKRKKLERLTRALSSGAALAALLEQGDGLRGTASAMDAEDQRLKWLAAHAPTWRTSGDKTLVFVEHLDTLEWLRTMLSQRAQLATGVFHEALPTARRDLEVARFRDADGPSLLISTECGGEGRNFEFCTRLVLFDLPWHASVVEQRIGRLDRIGRRAPIDVVYFVPPRGIGADVVRGLEALGLFRVPLSGAETDFGQLTTELQGIADVADATLDESRLATITAAWKERRSPAHAAAFHALHRYPYRAELADDILKRIPPTLDTANERAIVNACARLGLHVEQVRGHSAYAIELGSGAVIDGLPGVPGGSAFVGTFDRDEAVMREDLDFFASGHPLVEGIFAYFDDSSAGRVGYVTLESGPKRAFGILAAYQGDGPYDVVTVDENGTRRDDWTALTRAAIDGGLAHDSRTVDPSLLPRVHRLAAALDPTRRPIALILLDVQPERR